jgi:uncharacterized protein (TIGR00288 family)
MIHPSLPPEEKRVALLIDFENIKPSSLKQIVERASIFGMVTVKRAYADWSTRSEAKNILSQLGIDAVHHFRATRGNKNASDICLTVEAMDLLYLGRADVYVLVTADSDFVRLVRRLREDGKMVVGMGSRGVVSQALISVCDRYLFVEELAARESTDGPPDVEHIVHQAIDNTADEAGFVLGSRLHQAILKLDPSFDYRDPKWNRSGQKRFKTFGDFLRAFPSLNLVHDADKGGLLVSLAETEGGAKAQGPAGKKPAERPQPRGRGDEKKGRGGRKKGPQTRKKEAQAAETSPAQESRHRPRPPKPEPREQPLARTQSKPSKDLLPQELRSALLREIEQRGGALNTQTVRSLICKTTGKRALKELGVRTLRELIEAHPRTFQGFTYGKGGLKRAE